MSKKETSRGRINSRYRRHLQTPPIHCALSTLVSSWTAGRKKISRGRRREGKGGEKRLSRKRKKEQGGEPARRCVAASSKRSKKIPHLLIPLSAAFAHDVLYIEGADREKGADEKKKKKERKEKGASLEPCAS